MKIYVLGNADVEIDSLPLRILPKLKEKLPDIEFIEIDPTEEFPEEEELILIDTVINTDKVRVLDDIDKIESSPNVSLHDFDLGFQLKLAKKLGKIENVKIICVPSNISEDKAIEDIIGILDLL